MTNYYVVAIRYPRRMNGAGFLEPAATEAVVDPDLSREEVIRRLKAGDYHKPIQFIHEVNIEAGTVRDVTNELLAESGFYNQAAE